MPNQPGSDSRKIIEGQEGRYSRTWVQVRTGHYLPDGEQPVVITAKRNRNCIGHFPSPRFGSGFLLKRDDIRIRISSPFHFPSLYILEEKQKSEPVPNGNDVRIFHLWYARCDSNARPLESERVSPLIFLVSFAEKVLNPRKTRHFTLLLLQQIQCVRNGVDARMDAKSYAAARRPAGLLGDPCQNHSGWCDPAVRIHLRACMEGDATAQGIYEQIGTQYICLRRCWKSRKAKCNTGRQSA